jgi:hypothetical protein
MSPGNHQSQLQNLRSGDRLNYHGVEFQVADYSNYTDDYGYETQEWQLQSSSGQEYYLLREIDPKNPQFLVNWYLAEELHNPHITLPNYPGNIVPKLWEYMQSYETGYPELVLFGITYRFESKTEGTHESKGTNATRTTWDYWDYPHQKNLAIEAWSNSQLYVYSTKLVAPEEFSQIYKGKLDAASIGRIFSLVSQLGIASFMLLIGLVLLLF